MSEEKEIIKALIQVDTIRFFKDDFGILVCSLVSEKKGSAPVRLSGLDQFIVKGNMAQPTRGATYNLTAEYVEDPKWGGQYNVIAMCDSINFGEGDSAGQYKFLTAIFTENQVDSMYEILENPFEVLKKRDVQALVQIKGCGIKTANNWIKKFHDKYSIAKIYVELEDYNLTNNMINKLMDRYKSVDLVIEKVKSNPYILCNEVRGIGWKKADEIALDGGIDPYGAQRVSAYMRYYLTQKGENGCSWITCDELLGAIFENIGEEVSDEVVTESVHLIENLLWWNEDKTQIGLKKYFDIEMKIAKELIRIRDAESSIQYTNWEKAIKDMEFQQGWEYTEEQLEGIKLGLLNNLIVITGYGGTGKTSIVSGILNVLSDYSFVQCALSGRAGARMAEVTGKEGYTIHRLLEFPKGDKEHQGFVYHKDNPLPYDIYIIDEISMIDANLFYYLLRAIPSGAKLFLLGDPGQLESIGSGNVAHDMICSDEIPTVYLTKIHRQAAKSAIITESIKLRNGEQLIEKNWTGQETRGELQDLTLNCYSDASNTFYEVMKAFSKAYDEDDFNIMNCQIVVPIKSRGSACTYTLNNSIQELYNPKKEGTREEVFFLEKGKPYYLREGDKIINVTNNYQTSPPIYNGNIGVIRRFDYDYENECDIMICDFLGIGTVKIPKKYWGSIELAYATTTHKMQGSEFDHVIYAIDFSAYALLSREQVYTGITRAKKKCEVIAQSGALRMAIGTENVSLKTTHLQQCLYDIAHPKLDF